MLQSIQSTPLINALPLQTGDILVTTSIVPLISHYAVFYRDKDGKDTVADNVFWSQKLEVASWEEYQKKRTIVGVIRNDNTKVTDAFVQQKVEEAKKMNYNFFSYNCEDFVRSVCGCYIGTDQRIKYLLIFILILTVFIIYIKTKHT